MSWPMVSLEEISESIIYGLNASATNDERGPRFLRITDIHNSSVDWNTVPSCECSEKELEKFRLSSGDIVFARTGATTGKSCLIRNCPTDSVFASYLIRVRLNEKANPEYISHFFQSPTYWAQVRSTAVGAAQPGINATKLKKMQIPLPPIDEQKRIAAILDKADEIKQASDKTEDIRRQFGNAIFLDIFGDPVLNTKNWDTLPMTEIFEIITGKLDSNAAVEGGEYPFFTCAKEASQIDHFAFDCECLLLAGNNASGDFDVKYYNGKFNAYQRTYILTTDKINYDYAKFALNYQLKKLKQSSLGTNTRYLTMEIFKRMHIQIPSIDLQQQFSLYYNALKNSAGRDGFKVDELLKSTESLILMNH
jgi:restriction endonuclease S subunit